MLPSAAFVPVASASLPTTGFPFLSNILNVNSPSVSGLFASVFVALIFTLPSPPSSTGSSLYVFTNDIVAFF